MSLKIKDEVTPELVRLMDACADRKPVLEAMGAELVSITVRAFRDASLRALPWPLKKDGTPATLYKSGAMKNAQGPRVIGVGSNSVTVGQSCLYAPYHQLGTKHLPPRPFWPFRADGTMTPQAAESVDGVARDKIAKLIGH